MDWKKLGAVIASEPVEGSLGDTRVEASRVAATIREGTPT